MKNIVITLVTILLLIGCADDAIEPNAPPVIDALVIPDEVEAGAKIRLQLSKHDPDGDRLTVVWEADAGSINAILEEWTAPTHATTTRITAHLSDSINSAITTSKKIKVIAPSETTPLDDTQPIPPSVIDPSLPLTDPPEPVDTPESINTNEIARILPQDGIVIMQGAINWVINELW